MTYYCLLSPSYFDDDFCTRVTQHALSLPVEDIEYEADDAGVTLFRKSRARYLETEAAYPFTTTLFACLEAANDLLFDFSLSGDVEAPHFLEYHSSAGGRFDWHHDAKTDPTGLLQRQLSLVVQLSDPSEYEGGRLEFADYESPGTPFLERGSVLIFPAKLMHRVTPVTSGLRYSLATSAWGPV